MKRHRSTGPLPETHEAVMDATHRALCEHGYANLTMQRISDELGKSKSLLHYHYDGKEELLVSFLEHLLDEFDRTVSTEGHENGEETLRFTVGTLLPDADCHADFDTAMLEMGMQAPYNDDFRDQFRTNDARLKDLFSHIVADGVERGEFEEIDPDRAAEHLLILLDGARGRSVVLGTDAPNDVGRAAIHDFIGRITVGGDGE
ncbi:TetR/AcrR family transcriptional regulator [Haladaptatus sp. CMAA 1911]|uniref:TetR/AcrR family transcriptional regulator n=1 Tax=unclassified Haladaptatus TaxID=2622732 RepID=UPI003754A50E